MLIEMRKLQLTAILLAVLGAAALTACGADPITTENSLNAETTAVTDVTETTAEEAEETTTEAKKTTAAEEKATEAATDVTETETTTATEAAATTAEQAQQTEAPATQAPQQTEAPATEAPKQEQHLFDALKIGGSPADYVAAHPATPQRSDSCLEGVDLEYTYPDFVLVTNENNGVEKVVMIKITGAGISTREGIHVGSKREDVKNAYGAGDSDDFISKTTADGLLEIILSNGVVTEIDLSEA